ncbi:MAG: hypothetical protein GKR86_00140 [Ilumatobacter sp.]|nr:hypothetical protein [Ilumatobacter sp.]
MTPPYCIFTTGGFSMKQQAVQQNTFESIHQTLERLDNSAIRLESKVDRLDDKLTRKFDSLDKKVNALSNDMNWVKGIVGTVCLLLSMYFFNIGV